MKINIEHEVCKEMKEQITELAALGAMCASDDIDVDEEDFPATIEGWEKYQAERRKVFDTFAEKEKQQWFNGVLMLLGFEFAEDDLPYIRSSAHGSGFTDTVMTEARKRFPATYAALVLAKQKHGIERGIYNILRNVDW